MTFNTEPLQGVDGHNSRKCCRCTRMAPRDLVFSIVRLHDDWILVPADDKVRKVVCLDCGNDALRARGMTVTS